MFADTSFVHLNVHSVYSILESIVKIDEILKATITNNLKAVALTDYSSLCNASEFYTKTLNTTIKPIFGFEANVYSIIQSDRDKVPKRTSLVLLARNQEGWTNLVRLHNIAWKNYYYKPVLTYEQIEQHKNGLIVLSSNIWGDIFRTYKEGKDKFDEYIEKLDTLFPGNFYFEAQDVNDSDIQILNKTLMSYNHKFVITSNVHYLNKEDNKSRNLSVLISQKKKLENIKNENIELDTHPDYYYKTPAEIKANFTEEQWQECLKSCDEIYNKVESIKILDKPHLPIISDNPERDIRAIIKENLHKIPKEKKDEYFSRLTYELEVYRKTNSLNYLLIVYDFIQEAKRLGYLVNYGRGSACSSLVTYLLGIHEVDPIQNGLYFQRFLNESRGIKMKIF
jgi:DNA polymerase III subunit alpha